MNAQADLFSSANLASTVQIPKAPTLVPHQWPFPGMTPENSARAAIANSVEYREMLASVIKSQGGAELTAEQVMALVPSDWLDVCQEYAYANLYPECGRLYGIEVKYVHHDGGGFHFTYRAIEKL